MLRTICYTEEELSLGSRRLTRIRVRADLSGFDVEADTKLTRKTAKIIKKIRVRQQSFLAFARFYYNRICSAIEGHYEPLPALQTVPTALLDRSSLPTSDLNASGVIGSGMSYHRHPTDPSMSAELMEQLRVSVTYFDASTAAEMIAHHASQRERFAQVPDVQSQYLFIIKLQIRMAMSALHYLNSNE